MLRTRLYLGLLPLLLLIVATGGYAINVCRDLANSFSRDLINNYRAVIACQQMREAAQHMYQTLSVIPLTDSERKNYDSNRSAFLRELMMQSSISVGSERGRRVEALMTAFRALDQQGERLLRAGGSGSIADLHESAGALVDVSQAL